MSPIAEYVKDETTITKVDASGKTIAKVENPVALAKLTVLLTSNPASESVRNLAKDSEFVRSCSTGIGIYHAVRNVEKRTGDNVEKFTMTYELSKENVGKLFAAIGKIESALKETAGFVKESGNLPARGRKSLSADYSEC